MAGETMRAGWYLRPDIDGVMRVYSLAEQSDDAKVFLRQGFVWAAVFSPVTGGCADHGFLHQDRPEIQAAEPISQTQALVELTSLGVSEGYLRQRSMLTAGPEFSPVDLPSTELREQRAATLRDDPLAQRWVCVDFDYLKVQARQGGRQYNRGRERPVQAWPLQRATAIVAVVRPDLGQAEVLTQEQSSGPDTAHWFIELAAQADRVLGQNLLRSDYQAIAQIVDIPDDLITKPSIYKTSSSRPSTRSVRPSSPVKDWDLVI